MLDTSHYGERKGEGGRGKEGEVEGGEGEGGREGEGEGWLLLGAVSH